MGSATPRGLDRLGRESCAQVIERRNSVWSRMIRAMWSRLWAHQELVRCVYGLEWATSPVLMALREGATTPRR